jgi:hypothetical protein
VISVFIKGATKDTWQIVNDENTVSVQMVMHQLSVLPNQINMGIYMFKVEVKQKSGDNAVDMAATLQLHLAHKVSASGTQVKYLSTKVEIKLKKLELIHWASLERKADEPKQPAKVGYPTSAKNAKDWDHLVQDIKKEEKDEKPEGDAALNK